MEMLLRGIAENLAQFCAFPHQKVASPNVEGFCRGKAANFSSLFMWKCGCTNVSLMFAF